tara:strand:- start:8726 stop:10270 length:1545 start_codon:yes stop_codon:yes gene_type:complete
MTLAKFATMCELLEFETPTRKAQIISENLSSFQLHEKALVIEILSLELIPNNIAGKRAIKWVSNALGLFEDEVESSVSIWGDLGEGMFQYYEGDNVHSNIHLELFWSSIQKDCASIQKGFTRFADRLGKMSAIEKKWFLRYWLRKPRNGVNNKVPLKAMALHYKVEYKDVTKWSQYNSASDICGELEEGNTPECKLVHGNFLAPQLAKARKGKEKHSESIVDIKYDGNRYQIHKQDESIIIFNRKGKLVNDQYPDIIELVSSHFFKNGIMDTEIYPVDSNGNPAPHKKLATRVHSKDKAKAVADCSVKLVVFDLLKSEDKILLDSPYHERLLQLKLHVPLENCAEVFPLTEHTIQSAYNIAISRGFEGIMIKNANAPYHSGKRSKAWLKYKPPRISLDVVITSAKYGEGKRANVFGTYGISVIDGSDYVSVGSVGTGFSDSDLMLLTTNLKKQVESYDKDTFHFLPRVVLEVTADLVSTDDDGNIGLRFPRVVRVREDKYAKEADTLQTIREMM